MAKIKRLFEGSSYFDLVVAGIIVMCLGGIIWSLGKSKSNPSRKSKVVISNHTQSCNLIQAEKHNGHVKIALKNNSNKSVTAFVISFVSSPNDLFTIKEEFATADTDLAISPGETYEKVINLPNSINNLTTIPVDLTAVIFNDKSGEGDPKIIKGIAEERLGEKIQYLKSIQFLDGMLKLKQDELSVYISTKFSNDLLAALTLSETDMLDQLKKFQHRTISQQEMKEVTEQMKNGISNGKEAILHDIQRLENLQKNQPVQDSILWMKQNYERIVNRL
jgi:hypothetical protein